MGSRQVTDASQSEAMTAQKKRRLDDVVGENVKKPKLTNLNYQEFDSPIFLSDNSDTPDSFEEVVSDVDNREPILQTSGAVKNNREGARPSFTIKHGCSSNGSELAARLRTLHDSLAIPSEGSKLAQHGIIFQLKLLMLLLWRAKTNEYASFRLATELSECEKFDDVVFQYERNGKWMFRLLQAKHKEGIGETKKVIESKDLLSTDDKNEFSLQKYFNSFIKIKQRTKCDSLYSIFPLSEIEDIIVCTNIDLSTELRTILLEDTIENDDLLNVNTYNNDSANKKAYSYRINSSQKSELVETLQELFRESSDFHALVEELGKVVSEDIQVDKSGIFKDYYFVLSSKVFNVEDGKFRVEFLNATDLSEDDNRFRTALLKEIVFRSSLVGKYNIDFSEDFGKLLFPTKLSELEKLASDLAEDIISKQIKIHKYKRYSKALVDEIIDVKNKKFHEKFLNKASKFKTILKEKLTSLGHKMTISDMRSVRLQIPSDLGNNQLPVECANLARKICNCVKSGKQITTQDFEDYHIALASDVFDIQNRTWKETFIHAKSKDNKTLAPHIKHFRRTLIDHIIDDKEIGGKEMKQIKIKFSDGYKETLITQEKFFRISNMEEFAEQLKALICLAASNDKVVKVDDSSVAQDKLIAFKENIRKLAGNILIKRYHKIRFSSAFLSSDTLPSEIRKFRTLLKNKLASQFDVLFEYEFDIRDNKFKVFEEDVKMTQLPSSHSQSDVTEFFSKLKIIVNYPNREHLTKLMKLEMRNYFKELDTDDFNALYQEILHDWMAARIGTFYTVPSIEKLFVTLRTDLLLRKMNGVTKAHVSNIPKGYSFEYFYSMVEFLISEHQQIFHIFTESIELARIRIVQTFENILPLDDQIKSYIWSGGHIFVSTCQLSDKDFIQDILTCFEATVNLLIIECKREHFQYVRNTFAHALTDKREVAKKIILVSKVDIRHSEDESENIFSNESICLTKTLMTCNFDDLLYTSKCKFLDNLVQFQGRTIPLNKLCNVDECSGQIVNAETLENVIIFNNNCKQISIHDETYDLGDIKDYYIPRSFVGHEILTECDLIDNNSKISVISDVAGMGKSTVLTNLSIKIINTHPFSWVFRFDLNDYTKMLAEEQQNKRFDLDDAVDVVKFLLGFHLKEPKLKTNFEKQLFMSNFNTGSNAIIFLFDGFDEISPYYKDIVLGMFCTLKQSKIRKMLITTRPNMRDELVKELDVLAYTLEPFALENRKEFLSKFWERRIFICDYEENRLETYVECLINKFSKAIDDRLGQFAGVALQLRMIAEVFLEYPVKEESSTPPEWQGCKDFLLSKDVEPHLPDHFNLYSLYREFVNKKYEIYFLLKKHEDKSNVAVKNDRKLIEKMFLDQHQILALYSIFEHCINIFFPPSETGNDDISLEELGDGKQNIGLIERIGSTKTITRGDKEITFTSKTPRFVHRTFAEYFAAHYISNLLLRQTRDDLTEDIVDFIFTQLLIEPQYAVVRYFIDNRLVEVEDNNSTMPVPESPIVKDTVNILLGEDKLSSEDGQSCLHILARENHEHIIRLIWNSIDDELKEMLIDKCDNFGVTVLHVASRYGHFGLVKWLLTPTKDGGGGANTEATDANDYTPLLTAADHENVVKWFIKKKELGGGGADKYATSKHGERLIHIYIDCGNLEMAQWLLTPEAQGGGGVDINVEDGYGHKLIHYCANSTIFRELLTWLITTSQGKEYEGIDINARDSDGNTILHYAAYKGQLEILKWLLKPVSEGGVGGNINITSADGSTLLHEAALSGNLELIKWLLCSDHVPRIDALAKDNNGRSVLHDAAKYGNIDVIKLLMENYTFDICDKDVNGSSALHEAVRFGSLELVQYFASVDNNIEILMSDNGILHLAASHGELALVQWLISFVGINVNSLDQNNRSALHEACRCVNTSVATWLILDAPISEGAVNMVDVKNSTPLHEVVSSSRESNICSWLVDMNVYPKFSELDSQGVYEIAFPEEALANIRKMLQVKINETNTSYTTHRGKVFHVDKFSIIKVLLDKGARINIRDYCGRTALHAAVNSDLPDYLSIIKLLTSTSDEEVNDYMNILDGNEKTIFHYAVDHDQYKLVEWFFTSRSEGGLGRDFTALFADDTTIIEYAFRREKTRILKELIKVMNENEIRKNYKHIIFQAVEFDNLDFLIYLLDLRGIQLQSYYDDDGRTVMYYAAKFCSLKTLRYFIRPQSKHGEGLDVNLADKHGKTCLHYAAQLGKINVVKFLITVEEKYGGPASVNVKDSFDETPLEYAVKYGRLEVVKLFFTSSLASSEVLDVNYRYRDGKALLHIAVEYDQPSIIKWLGVPKYKGGGGADINCGDKEEKTPLHYAGILCRLDTVKWLVLTRSKGGGGADVYAGDIDGKTVLHYAAQAGNLVIFKWLLDPRSQNGGGIDINVEDHKGRTPLFYAVDSNQEEIIEFHNSLRKAV